MYKTLAIVCIIAIPVTLFFLAKRGELPVSLPGVEEERPLVFFADQVPLRVEIADTDAKRLQGLSGRRELGPTAGILFVHDKADYHGIWMKDMLFPIDIIWIGENLRVVDIAHNVYPDTYPRIFEPVMPARFIIETNANYAESFKIRVGDAVTLPARVLPRELQN